MNSTIAYLLARLAEPSTWNGIGGALLVFGVNIPGPLWQAITGAGSGLAFLAGMLLKEGSASASATAPVSKLLG